MTSRFIVGVVGASVIAFGARAARSLTMGGAIAAAVLGTLAISAGWLWGTLLILYFVASTLLSHLGRREKERRTQGVVAKGGERDAVQVLANGLVFGIGAVGWMVVPSPWFLALGAGSLSASAADTWATEIGTLWGRQPRSILNGRVVPAGTSGGVSVPGVLASVAGAMFVAVILQIGGFSSLFTAIVVAGVAGAFADSLLGATLQARRWCAACSRETERGVHDCGAQTHSLRGIAWLDNDAVNLASAAVGGLLASALVR
jgi:uncharacterized protein (TIGR00297 family)